MVSATSNPGWVQVSWTYSFYFLKSGKVDYEECVREVLLQGGDTDSNACIVGGMIGAVLGLERMKGGNEKRLEVMLSCEVSGSKQVRPGRYNPSEGLALVEKLVRIAPEKLVIV